MEAPRALAAKPPSGRKMKSRAPPPPGKPATLNVHCEQNLPRQIALGSQQNLVHMKEALQNSTLDITVVLPSGVEKQNVVSGSHAMMDLLVELCLQNHLNPSHHTLEALSSETQQPLSFKPNTLVGTLNVQTVFLKEKGSEEKVKPGLPKVPEKSVRLVVNYLRTQKAVMRVSPEVPLQNILPVICAKCEVSPDHVVLLRDNIAGEELELSKSLNELGIKELYAWDNRRETLRKSSLGNDETDKEKKKFLGFFKVNKRSSSKAEQLGLSGAESDEDTSKSVAGRGVNGCLTTPNSPSLHSRSLTLGPSLSLGNISGMSVKSDMKKRRAPPPPRAVPPVQDKASEKVSLSSQVDLQKKKRRAPAPPPPQPPPPSPLVPNRREDKEENRKSTVGVGRQVPQKPPRGTARGPPQLVLPPPPPYPPPDTDVVEPLGFPGEGAGSEASELRPRLSLPLGTGSHCSMDGVPQLPLEAEETGSVGSCFASEDTTEDSGVMSSPSDIVSLDSQHDSLKFKDKWATDQEDCSDQDLAGTPDLGPQKSPSWERNGSGSSHPRNENAIIPSNDDEDLLITGQFHRTLAELDEDLEEMEESFESDLSSLTNSINGVSNHCMPEAIIHYGDTDTIPVTFIGEVSDDPVDSGLLSNGNNNAGSIDKGDVTSRSAHPLPFQPENSQPHGRRLEEGAEPCPPSQDITKGIQSPLPNTSQDGNSIEIGSKVTSFTSELYIHGLSAKGKGKVQGSSHTEKTQDIQRVNSKPTIRKDSDNDTPALVPPPWSQRGHTPGRSSVLKYGLTTYKIVPPKSEMKCYDRGVSLSTGAIKIDELGNLVSPQVNGGRTISLSSTVAESEAPPIGRVKEFWMCTSAEKHVDQPIENSAKQSPTHTTTTTSPAKPPQDHRLQAAQQQPVPREYGSPVDEERSQPPSVVTKVPAASATEVPFLKPQRRTSSQYVASAIAKRIGPMKVHSSVARQLGNCEKSHEDRGPKLVGSLPTMKDNTASPNLYSEAQGKKPDTKQPCARLHSSPGVELAVGAHAREEVSYPARKLPTQDCPSAVHKSSYFPPVLSSQKDPISVGQGCGFSEKQSTSNQKTSSASDPMHPPERAPPSPLHLAEAPSSSRALVNGSTWVSGNSEYPCSPKLSSRIILETEEKPSVLASNAHETDGTLPPSIFGPKKKFKPVIQKPVPKDTSLHSALMEAIHTAGGRDKLRKTAEHTSEGGPKKPSYTEAESERSALLAAIRGHSGACSLRKVSSLASEELQSFRAAEQLAPGSESPQQELTLPPPPALPAPPLQASQAPSAAKMASRFSMDTFSNSGDARQALMDAIRSGTGAARLRKVPLLV
ncbi:protein cordon-bleu isoform X2 [Perognathus longimembris pacificus]|uniref:protein cordon-bleu isoform X2 n=1 Tax=Perognathus longimembris pacificus TaxID=214514 RepID=UPI002019753F|nr:protein cordon-bleu isoform X2 [Perognathus longimembris pacificus]